MRTPVCQLLRSRAIDRRRYAKASLYSRSGQSALSVGVLFGMLIAAGTLEANARTLVIHATGPTAKSYPPGRVLDEKIEIFLKQGDRLTLLDDQGTRQLRGPAIVRLDARVKPLAFDWENLVGSNRRRTSGGVRSLGGSGSSEAVAQPQTMQNRLWQIDPTVSGDWCILDDKTVSFWRSDTSVDWKLDIEGGSKLASVVWPRGRDTMDWPKAVPIKTNLKYTIYMSNRPKREVSFHKIVLGGSALALGQSLAANRCYQQLSVLLGP